MTLTARQPWLRCGKRFGTEDEALHSKLALAGGHGVVPCAHGCGGWHLERVQEAPAARLSARDTGPDAATRAAVYARDGHACVCCGESVLRRPHSIGHRLRRSQGGKNLMSHLLTFLGFGSNAGNPDDHHARIDSRRNPQDEIRGYSVRSRTDPASVPVFYAATADRAPFWALLEADGGLVVVDAPGEAA